MQQPLIYKLKFLIFLSLALGTTIAFALNVSPTTEETRLYELVNEYRAENGLPAIPFSSSLTYVAQTHVKDLQNHPPSGTCNMHSWSANGAWSSCCYTSDHAQAQCMWDKPRELTSYPGNGYENAYGGSSGYIATAQGALDGWKNSSGHNAVILNQNTWKNVTWKALGVGIYQSYAVLWFGEEVDPVQTTSTTTLQPVQIPKTTGISFEFKSNAIFDRIEKDYAALFYPASATQVIGSGTETLYIRVYNNPYQSALATTFPSDFWFAINSEWERFGTLEEANQYLCNNQCWNVSSNPSTATTGSGRIKKSNNVFIDTQTGLEWIADDIINKERDEAIAYCNGLNYGGYRDWRLPTNSELSSFVKALDQSSVRPDYLGSFSGCLAGIATDGYTALTSKHVPFGEEINFRGHAAVICVR